MRQNLYFFTPKMRLLRYFHVCDKWNLTFMLLYDQASQFIFFPQDITKLFNKHKNMYKSSIYPYYYFIINIIIIIIIIITGSYAANPVTFHERHSSGLSIEWISLIIVISGIAVIAVIAFTIRYVGNRRRPRRPRHTRHPKLGR